jgi:hypothetical protein
VKQFVATVDYERATQTKQTTGTDRPTRRRNLLLLWVTRREQLIQNKLVGWTLRQNNHRLGGEPHCKMDTGRGPLPGEKCQNGRGRSAQILHQRPATDSNKQRRAPQAQYPRRHGRSRQELSGHTMLFLMGTNVGLIHSQK